jgi:[CysO sulfur-carrier protein]-S-L-cysteine hydrolase
MLKLACEARDEIIAHARQDTPVEACGYLAERDGVVSRVFRLSNADASPVHYALVPAEQFSAVREMRESGHELRAVYHSHPASPARMSPEDMRLAFECGLSYVIISLAGEEPVVNSFTIGDGLATAEEIEMIATVEERR